MRCCHVAVNKWPFHAITMFCENIVIARISHFNHRATSSTFLTPITTIAMAEPPPTTDVDHDDELPKKKKPKRQEKPVPTFLQDLVLELINSFYENLLRYVDS